MPQPITTTPDPAATRKQERLDAVMRWMLRSPLHRVASGKLLIVGDGPGRNAGRSRVIGSTGTPTDCVSNPAGAQE
ncbi:hypothetical protein [Nocardia aurantiaca]|uniref:Uncharacterized protein n=1 Tax=Nocardia aurantiaca TaxID=2675850 RepID=A0A6I3L1G3_9NOCA|nr:hypothetical protein [Nocardia aurantiaca]MTE14640.1 hypothetical protein [Nocardia aurantiaca]